MPFYKLQYFQGPWLGVTIQPHLLWLSPLSNDATASSYDQQHPPNSLEIENTKKHYEIIICTCESSIVVFVKKELFFLPDLDITPPPPLPPPVKYPERPLEQVKNDR